MEVYRLLRQKYDIVGVFTVPDVKGRVDPLGMFIFTLLSLAIGEVYIIYY